MEESDVLKAKEQICHIEELVENARKECDFIARIAALYINWTDSIHCDYYHGEGVCMLIHDRLIKAVDFFDLIKGKSEISEEEIKQIMI